VRHCDDYDQGDPVPPEMPGYDDDGNPVLVVAPLVYDSEPEPEAPPPRDYGRLFSLLLIGATDAETVRRRVLCWAYLLKAPHGPQTLDQLGLALGITKQAAHKWLTAFRRHLPEIMREAGFTG